jgi:hypothetical protein
MPSTSKKQQKFMAAVANNPAFAKKAGVPKSVGEEFMKADKMKYKDGGKVEDWKAMGFPSKEMYEKARDAETDRKMKEGMEKYMKTRVGGGKKKMARGGEVKMARGGEVKMARGGKVRGCGIAKQGVRKAKMY